MLLTMMATTGTMWGETVKYTITSRNTLTTTGTVPTGSSATIVETYGTSCQMTKGNSQTLTLTNYYGYSISNITLSMKSNQSSGAGKLSYSTDGGTTFTYIVGSSNAGVSFNQAAWNGSWSTSYVDISKDVTIIPESGKNIIIKIEATANSLYCRSYQLTYTSGTTCATPTFTPAAGAVLSGSTVAISTTTDGATIYYTMGANPDDPTTSSDVYSEPIEITEATTIKAMAVKDGYNNSSIASASYTIATPLTTMQEIFDDATANTSAHQVFITFDNWVITGNNGNNPTTAFLSDGTNGCRIYNNGGVGFAKGDILSGTASCNLSLYYGMAQLNLTSAASGLTIQTGGEVTPVVTTIDALTGIKAGSVVTLQGLTYNGSILTDGENSITPYNYMYSASLENDHVYNVTGVFEYGYNSVKRINPRDENDIEEVIITTPTISASNVDIACTATGGEIAYTINNPVDGGSLSATTESDWLILNSNFDSPIAFTCSSNTATEERTATVALTYTYNAKASVTKNVTVTQAAYEAPNVTWDLSTDQTATATTTEMTWTSNYVTMAVAKGSASTNTNNYYPGTSGQNYTSTRFYKNSILTITPVAGYDLSSIEFTATTEGYATTLKNSTWTNATASVSGTIVTVTPTNGTTAISATIGGTCGFTSVKVYYTESSDPAVATTVTIDATGITNTDVYTSTEAGSLSATVHAGETLIDGASVTWESSNSDAATIDENGVVTLVAAGTTTITASYAGVENQYKPSSATYELTVINSNAPGTENNPYTVADAMAAIDAQGTINEAYVTGIVSQVDSYNSSYHSITYWISDDGETTTQLEVYSGKGLNGANFSSVADVQVGATVVVKGKLKLYNQTYEFDYNNELVSYTAPQVTVEAPTFSPAAGTYDEAQSVTLSCTTEGSTIYYTTDGTNPTNESTEYTAAINVENTTTIKAIAYVGNDYSTVATATYTIVTLNNISDITEVGTAYSVKGTVVATNNKGLIIGDGTGYVYYYNNGSVDQSIGDMIKISGNTVTYGQIIQFTSATPNTATITEATTSSYDGTPAAAVITEVPDYSEGYHLSTYLEFTGDLAKSGSNYLITVGEGENNQIQISYPTTAQSEALTALVGMTVRVKGYFSGINSSSKFTVMLESAEEMLVPSITLTPSVINEAPADGGSGEITVTCANMGENPVLSIKFCDANGDPAEYDWISAVFNDTYTKITGTFTENTTTEPRTAHLKVYGTVPNSTTIVYSDIFSITQLAPAGPSIVFETTSMDLEAGGETDRKLSFDYSGLGSTPTFTINYYEQDGETEVTAATYDWLTASIDENDKLNITVGANTGEARSAYLKVYGVKNENVHAESNLVTITQAEYVDPTQDIVDILDLAFTGVTGTGYSDWSNKTGTSGAVYAGNSAGGNSAIQFRTDNSNSGIVTTTSAGKITKVEVTWNSNTADGRTLNIYGSNTAYTAASNLYGDNAGTLIGTIVYGTSTELTISDEYAYIGLRSSNKALYLDEIKITWTTGPAVPSITVADATVNVDAGGVADATLALTYANLTITDQGDFDIQYYDENGDELGKDDQPDWMEASIQAAAQEGYEVSYSVIENEGEARTAYFKVYALDDNAEYVYSNLVTISQAAYVAPVATITVYPLDIQATAAETVDWLAITLENIDITEDGGGEFDLVFCDNDGNPLSEKPAWFEFDFSFNDVWSMPYTILANTETTARTLYFKIYGLGDDGETEAYSDLVTVTQAGYVVDYAELPFEWEGGTTANFNALNGTSTYSVGDYGDNQGVYRMKLDATGDYIQVKTNEQPGVVTIGVKMIGGGNTSTITVQGSADGESFTDIEELTISGNQNDVLNLETTNDFATTDRYVRLYFNKGSNVGVGPITIAQVDLTPSITVAPATLNLNCDGGDGELTVTHKNLADDPQLAVIFVESDGETQTTCDWIEASINANGNVAGHIDTNTGEARTAYLKVTGRDAENNLIKSNLVTFNQAAYTEPSIVFETTTLDIVAGGENRTMSFDYEGLGQNPTFSINFYESDGTTAATYPWLTALITPEEKVDITVSANEGAARSAYFKVSGVNGEVNALSNLVTINQAAYTQLATYSLVTSVDDIVSGKHYIIASSATDGAAYAMGGQTTNNRSGVAVTIENGQIAETENVYEFVINTHESSSKDVVYTIYDAVTPGYLYASSSSANQLKTTTTLNDNGKWAIEISSTGAATITAQGSNNRKLMRYNPNNNSPIFACYATTTITGNAPCLYVKDNDEDYEYYGMDITYTGTSIPAGETLTVGAGSVMTVPDNFVNDYPEALVIQEGGQLIHKSDVQATVQKSVAAYTAKDGDGWYLIASPVDELSTSGLITEPATSYDLFIYNEPNAYWYSNIGTGAPFDILERGKGYLYANANNIDLDFAGLMIGTETEVTKTLSFAYDGGGDLKGYNLMGNPFTRNLGAGDITLGGKPVTSVLLLNNDEDYQTCNFLASGVIKPGQGFFIQAESEGQQLVFNPSSSKDANEIGLISIEAGDENFTDKAYIQFGYGNTLRKMTFGENTMVYVMNDDLDYAAARVEELAGTMPVHFVPIEDGFYTITVETKNIENLNYMHLIDNIKNTEIDLLVEPSYTFKASESDNADRFYLVFDFNNYTGINENYTNDNFAHQIGDEIFVSGEGTLQVFDVLGRFVTGYNVNGDKRISTAEFNTGVYIFRMVGTEVKTQKIIVR